MLKVLFVALAAVATGAVAQDIVLQDSVAPRTVSVSFSEDCAGAGRYSLDLTGGAAGRSLVAHHDGVARPVTGATLLGSVTGTDLYAVNMHCAGHSATIVTQVYDRRAGRMRLQYLGIGDDGGVRVSPVREASLAWR